MCEDEADDFGQSLNRAIVDGGYEPERPTRDGEVTRLVFEHLDRLAIDLKNLELWNCQADGMARTVEAQLDDKVREVLFRHMSRQEGDFGAMRSFEEWQTWFREVLPQYLPYTADR